MIRGLNCDYKVTVCAAKDLQQTKFMSRHDGVFDEKKDKAKSDVDPYVMIGKNTTVLISMRFCSLSNLNQMWTKYSWSGQPQSRKFAIQNGTKHSQQTCYAPLRR